MAFEERRRVQLQQHHHDLRIAALHGVLWVGTDDGNVQVSRDGGATLTKVGEQPARASPAPSLGRASSVALRPATCLRRDRRPPQRRPQALRLRHPRLRRDLDFDHEQPARDGNLKVIREDPKNQDLLYVGTEFGLFISLNGGGKLEEVHERTTDRAHRRHPSSTRATTT